MVMGKLPATSAVKLTPPRHVWFELKLVVVAVQVEAGDFVGGDVEGDSVALFHFQIWLRADKAAVCNVQVENHFLRLAATAAGSNCQCARQGQE